jgi:hypothetical protein
MYHDLAFFSAIVSEHSANMARVQINLDGGDVRQISPVALSLRTSATITLASIVLVQGEIVEGTYIAIGQVFWPTNNVRNWGFEFLQLWSFGRV